MSKSSSLVLGKTKGAKGVGNVTKVAECLKNRQGCGDVMKTNEGALYYLGNVTKIR